MARNSPRSYSCRLETSRDGTTCCKNQTVGVTNMNRVIAVEPIDHYKLRLTFSEGQSGIFDMISYIEQSDFFAELKEVTYFKQVSLFFRGIDWANGQDMSPDTLLFGLISDEKYAA